MNMNRIIIKISATILLLISLVFVDKAFTAYAEESDNTICKGVFIDEVDVSGMSKVQAEAAIDEYMDVLRSKGLAISVGDNTVYTTLGDLGYKYEPNDNITQALDLGKSGNLIKRYKDLKDIEQGNVVYPLTFTFDDKKVKEIVSVDVGAYNVAPVNATIARKDGEFIYTDHVVGSKVNVDLTIQQIKDAINNWNRQDIVIEAVMDEDIPVYTREIVESCNTVLGSYTTEYTDSAQGRAANLANGARLINNTVIYPGEVFSSYEHLTPFTEDNGYHIAGAYLQGRVIDSVGGGACQVTTTLYNAVLGAELEVVERMPHSMTISYVDLSRDAAIAGTYKDFKFKNNTDVPILVEATTVGRKITFKLWGKETRDIKSRKVEYVTVVLKETPPPKEVVTEDPTQPTTYRKVTQSAHTGYKAELYKVVYENGVEVSRTLVNKSNYSAAPRYVTIGTKKEEKNPEDDKKPDKSKDEKPKNDKTDDTTEEKPSTDDQNLTNPDGQLQGDIWDPTWDLESYED
jgi:vancomycin resistance protein YoaR